MRRTMDEVSAGMLLTDDPLLLQENWCMDVRELVQNILADNSMSEAPDKDLTETVSDNEAGFIFQTSGTAGEPKWVQCGYRQYSTVIDCMLSKGTLEHARGQSVFLTPPLYHSYGLSSFLEYTAAGSTVIFPQGTSPLGSVGELGDPAINKIVTAIEAVPFFYIQLSKLAHRFELPVLKHLGLGGGGMDPVAFDRLLEMYPAITVSVRYGMTETPSVVSHKVFSAPFSDERISSGSVLPVYSVAIVDRAGREVDKNQEGLIRVSGECLGNYPGGTENCLLTGDTGYMTDSNELVVTGRESLYIKNRGFRISPEQIESVITSFTGVTDCRVRSVDSRLVAEVVYDDGVSSREILAYMQSRLPEYAIADEVVRVESVPRTHSGKIKRHH